jgi:hypothetical protein
VPGGPSFSIVGQRIGEPPSTQLELNVEVEGQANEATAVFIAFGARARAAARSGSVRFAVQTTTGCRPQEYAVLYGVLHDPRDTVLARSAGQLTPFREAPIPALLRAGGVLAYSGLKGVPAEVLVRSPAGKTIAVERFAQRAREARETCEGEAEPGA